MPSLFETTSKPSDGRSRYFESTSKATAEILRSQETKSKTSETTRHTAVTTNISRRLNEPSKPTVQFKEDTSEYQESRADTFSGETTAEKTQIARADGHEFAVSVRVSVENVPNDEESLDSLSLSLPDVPSQDSPLKDELGRPFRPPTPPTSLPDSQE